MEFTFTSQLHYLVHQVDGEYVAHCLDLDLIGSGKDVESAVAQLNYAVIAVVYFCMKSGAKSASERCHRAPDEYWDKFRLALDEHGSTIRTLDVAPEIAPVNVMECHFTYCLAIAA